MTDPADLSATEAARRLRDGSLTALALTEALLDRVAAARMVGCEFRRRALIGVIERRAHEAVAIVEVVVEERRRHAGLRGDLLHAQAAHAPAGDHRRTA